MNNVQKAAIKLIENDLRFLYSLTIELNDPSARAEYALALLPYIGVIIDGVENWLNSYNNSNKRKIIAPKFTKEEKEHYSIMRNAIKLWDNDFATIYEKLNELYYESDKYFSNLCKPIARHLKLYDIYGIFTVNKIVCNNTILSAYYYPNYSFDNIDGEKIKSMSEIAGKYISLFNAYKSYNISKNIVYDNIEYGGFIKSPVGNKFNKKFVLFCLMCQVNFITECINKTITDEVSTKLRFGYLLYYYICNAINDINNKCKTKFVINNKYYSTEFRNAMAHYKLGVSLSETDLIYDDFLFGLTNKIFSKPYLEIKNFIYQELENLSKQIQKYLNIK